MFRYFLIIAIVALPGVYVAGELIHFVDVLLPLVFLKYFLLKRRRILLKPWHRNLFLTGYVIFALFSIIMASVMGESGIITALMKWLRLFYILPVIYIARNYRIAEGPAEQGIIKATLLCGIATALLGIILFILQSPLYQSTQTMRFMGKVMHRAGGIFKDAGSFSFMLVLIIALGMECLKYSRMLFLSAMAIGVSLVGIVLSYNRTAFLAILVLAAEWGFEQKQIHKKELLLIMGATTGLVIACICSPFVQSFLADRIMPLFSLAANYNKTTAIALSSGRLTLWTNQLAEFQSSGFFKIIWGCGYKIGLGAISDNNFLSVLFSTGLSGLVCFLIFWIREGKYIISHRKMNFMSGTAFHFLSVVLVYMIFADAMTMSRPIYLAILFFAIAEHQNDYHKHNTCLKLLYGQK